MLQQHSIYYAHLFKMVITLSLLLGGRDGAVVRALTSHQCGPGLNPGVDAICGLSLLLVLVPGLRVFFRFLQFFSPHKNQHFKIPIRPERTSTFEFEFLSGDLFGAQRVNKYVFVFSFILTITIIMVTIITTAVKHTQ